MNCKFCGKPGMSKGVRNGKKRKRNVCAACYTQIRRAGYPYGIHKKDKCESCGFIPVHSCQLDVDHKDGNRENNHTSNLITLCANCHRLKTELDRSTAPFSH